MHNKEYYHISHTVKVYFERRKIAKVFVIHMQHSFQKSLSTATSERKLSKQISK